jgi:type I restriction-modification system DNA methylase subunit
MLTIEHLRKNAVKFAKEFESSNYEMGEAQSFIIEFCKIFELNYRRAVSFEKRVKKLSGKQGRIDGFFPGLLLIEMKSAGEDLDKAYRQATEYFSGLKDEEMPRCVLISDFQNLHLYNQETHSEPLKIKLAELPQYIEHFRFLTGYEKIAIEKQERINKAAAEKMADLHDAIKATGYSGKDLETYLVRLLFCLFAEDTGLFGENNLFLDYLKNYTQPNGSDLHGALTALFDTLNRDKSNRPKNLPEHLAVFPYVNGSLFEGTLAQCYFDEAVRNTLIECAELDWSEISPAIFGSLFQAIMHFDDEAANAKTKKRREFGAHYTSEENILKTINPLFMDDLRAEFEKIRRSKPKLAAFHQKLAHLNFFDPACGCGNFLIIAYRELRLLELDVIKALFGKRQVAQIDVDTLILCNVHQFHGIDIDESAAQIATLALWLVDHQMNLRVQELGLYYNRIPLVKKANIVCANALQLDWESVISPKECSFIMGNPPFIGHQWRTPEQMQDMDTVWGDKGRFGRLDYVTCWHKKATEYIKKNPKIPVAFVSTNSICQGEQVGILWAYLLAQGVRIHFAHRTFRWSNEGKGVAAVHCVIVGFGLQEPDSYRLFDYDDISGQPSENKAFRINPYLVDAPDIILPSRTNTPEGLPQVKQGSKPVDSGHFLFTEEEKKSFVINEPTAEKWLHPYMGSDELINGNLRWCLWLKDINPAELKAMPEVMKRVKAVADARLKSPTQSVREFAEKPTLFTQDRQPKTEYLAIPEVSSENRRFIPIGYFTSKVIASNKLLTIPEATLYHFGILCSTFHNAWMRYVAGRLKSDYSYSPSVYNNFPWPTPTEKQLKTIEEKAQAVLDARAEHKTSTLADLYNPLTMPPNLVKAHNELDKAIDAAYGYKGKKDDAERVAFLFELYQKLTAPMLENEPAKKARKHKTN